MLCYECAVQGVQREAIGMCHNCSLALCLEHARVSSTAVLATYGDKTHPSVRGTVELPLKERRLLCGVCQPALAQGHDASTRAARASAKDTGQGKSPRFHQAA